MYIAVLQRLIWSCLVLIAVDGLWASIYGHVRTSGGITLVSTLLVTAVIVAAIAVARREIAALFVACSRWIYVDSTAQFLIFCIVFGWTLRAAWVFGFRPLQVSDYAQYVSLAEGLIKYGTYDGGVSAYWPPGMALFLVPPIRILPDSTWAPVVNNLFLYGLLVVVTYILARLAAGKRVAQIASLLLAVWPNHVFATGLAMKELLIATLLPLAILLFAAPSITTRWSSHAARLAAGGCLGFAALTQPSTVLFPLVLVNYEVLSRRGLREATMRLLPVAIGLVIVISPWTVRNFFALHAFVPVSTNGAVVFLSANNPKATGGWIQMDYEKYRRGNELEGARMAYREAFDWIRANPVAFALLTVKKQVRFLQDDDAAAVTTLWLARGIKDYRLSTFVILSNVFWYAILVLVLVAALEHWVSSWRENPLILSLIVSVVYFFLIHSIFQSESKHHLNVIVSFAILAALAAKVRASPSISAGPAGTPSRK